ncbi:hypothetical protein [Legionella brunensis]|uniref:hypothetical protein n=1 Tax=Legionella brunensis TaxID=29422 RepID=UPI000B0DB2A4|nr:hypothetical protein [Legionella brunensis]
MTTFLDTLKETMIQFLFKMEFSDRSVITIELSIKALIGGASVGSLDTGVGG